MRYIFRFIFFVAILLFLPFYFQEFRRVIFNFDFSNPIEKYFIISFIVSTVVFHIILKAGNFFAILEHEFTHIVWGLLFFKSPKGLVVEEDYGGYVEMYGGNFLIALAPYFFQTFNFMILPFYPLIKREYELFYFIVFGIILGYHTSSTIKEFHLKQPDFYVAGLLFSLIFILVMNIITYGMMFAFVQGKFGAMWKFLANGARDGVLFINTLLKRF